MIQKKRCERYIGKMIRFRTPYGVHKGIVERVTDKEVILLSPKSAIPAQLAHAVINERVSPRDITLAYGGAAPGGNWGGGGYGAWGYGWSRWAVAFLIIYVLWGLWLW